jgi:hypothetical protein
MNKGVKNKSEVTLIKKRFSKFLAVSCNCGFKVSKKCLYDPKTLSSRNLTVDIKKARNFMLISKPSRKHEKVAH